MLEITVLYSPGENQPFFQRVLNLSEGSTVADALSSASFYEHYPEARDFTVGIFSHSVALDQGLKEGDRVEIYRPLLANPMDARRHRAKKRK